MALGRKPNPPEQQRRFSIRTGLTRAEWDAINAKAHASKMARAEFVRKAALEQKLRRPRVEQEALQELKRIGVNINQLTKRGHQAGFVVPEEMQAAAAAALAAIKKLVK